MKSLKFGLLGLLMTLLTANEAAMSGGCSFSESHTHFRLSAPGAEKVELILFEDYTASDGRAMTMDELEPQVFTLAVPGDLSGQYYGYRVYNSDPGTQEFPPETIVADPYSLAVATQNRYNPIHKTLIYRSEFDWEDDTWMTYEPRDLIIYEAHIKDMSHHPSSGAAGTGAYNRFTETDQEGGIRHLIDMGYNAVELLPSFEFANVEIPYKDNSLPVYNTWNPYEANHWGYMTTFFFAPESQYASDGRTEKDAWMGADGRQVEEFKQMVKTLHEHGIAVILDVVYNHVSQYGYNPLKQISNTEYFRRDSSGSYTSASGCGNDLKTEHPHMRRLIVESIRYWMEEYHIDGFRFDLGLLIDPETMEAVRMEARKINPNVFLTCEPWGGGYDPNGFSDRNWSSWNDQFRNGIKGENALTNTGFIFGNWQGDLDRESVKRFFLGSHREFGGQYIDVAHSLNYLEAHDNHTLGDFIRLAIGKVGEQDVIGDLDRHAVLNPRELAIHKLAAMALLTSQGPVMIAEGQEWGRSKITAPADVPDENIGRIDHNSYAKDNETNWLNWNHKTLNEKLVGYYRGLITLRHKYPAFRNTHPEDVEFLESDAEFGIGFRLADENTELLVLLNGDSKQSATFTIPEGPWEILADQHEVKTRLRKVRRELVVVGPTSGKILRKSK